MTSLPPLPLSVGPPTLSEPGTAAAAFGAELKIWVFFRENEGKKELEVAQGSWGTRSGEAGVSGVLIQGFLNPNLWHLHLQPVLGEVQEPAGLCSLVLPRVPA